MSLLVAVTGAVGCGGTPAPPTVATPAEKGGVPVAAPPTHPKGDFGWKRELLHFALAYHDYYTAKQTSPGRIGDLTHAAANFPTVIEQNRSGDFVVVWNAVLSPDGNENDQYVLGYEKGIPGMGGWVVLGGGQVKHVTAEEFHSLPIIEGRPR